MGKQKNNAMMREHERIPATLGVRLAGLDGTTRNVSIGGIYFEFDTAMSVSREITFEIDINTPLGPMKLKCSGLVVRTEQNGYRTGIAVKMTNSQLEAAPQV